MFGFTTIIVEEIPVNLISHALENSHINIQNDFYSKKSRKNVEIFILIFL